MESGKQLLHYSLIEKVGEGGMGVVWKAMDTTLDREVAIKVLPAAFLDDAERLERFRREAKLLASLHHPNIASIFGMHSTDGDSNGSVRFLAMEFVPGEDLRERLDRGAFSGDASLDIARQIAEALETAHEQGIVHRDLKPANVKLTPDGKVKVLDFGLAKAFASDASGGRSDPSLSPTLTSAGTQAGLIIGTAAYMSPEQAKGAIVDRRADIWAFGVVLYEMLTGKQLFQGETISETLAAVLLKETELGDLPADTPPAVRALIERCLTRDPKARLRDIGEARIALENPNASSLSSLGIAAAEGEPAAAAPQPAAKRLLPWALAAILALALLVVAWAPWQTPPPPGDPIMLRAQLREGTSLFADYGAAAILSPQGDRLVYVDGGTSGRQMWMRNLDQPDAREISGSSEGYHPFFSPDGQWIGFVTREKLKKVSAFGGTPISLADVSLSRGATWGPDGTIVFAPSPNSGLMRIPAEGGEATPLTEPNKEAGEVTHRWPQFLPDGKALIFTAHDAGVAFDDARIELLVLETGERQVLHRGGSYARYVPTGHVVFVRESTLYAMPFDLDSLELTGTPFPVLEHITSNPVHGSAQYDFSQTGILVYSEGSAIGRQATVVAHQRDGTVETLPAEMAEYYGPRFSPSGDKMALTVGAFDDADAWIVDLQRGTRTRLTFSDKSEWRPLWSPDGNWIVFASDRNGSPNLYRKPADGSRDTERLTENTNVQVPTDWSGDGRVILYSEMSSESGWDLWALDVESGEAQPLVEAKFHQAGGVLSPDGRWVAYQSNESGRREVYVRPFPGPGGKWQISTAGGSWPRWSREGNELFYMSLEDDLVAVPVTAEGDRFVAGNPEKLFDASGYVNEFFGSYDVAPGGRRFAFLEVAGNQDGAPDRSQLGFVMNWYEQLSRLAGN